MRFEQKKISVFILVFMFPLVCWGEDFVSSSGAEPWRGVKVSLETRGNYFLPTGFTFEAILEGSIFSYNLLTPAIALVDENVIYLGRVVIPRGTHFIGLVQTIHTLDRVNINFHTCVFPDGQEIPVQNMALSLDGSAGIKGKLKTHKDAVAGKIAMKSVLAAVSAGAALAAPTVETAMVTGLSQEAMHTIETSNVKTADSIEVEERTAIRIFNIKRLEY
jgi:type IV secretory pathway VirB10-like protein